MPAIKVGNLPPDVGELELESVFRDKGYKVINAWKEIDDVTKKPTNFGFVEFAKGVPP